MNLNPANRDSDCAGSDADGSCAAATRPTGLVQFYHLTATPLERALPKLMEKAFTGRFRTLLVAESDARVDQLNQLLWTYDPGSFLPHGSLKEGNAEQQPILLVTSSSFGSTEGSPAAGDPLLKAKDDGKFNLLAITDGTQPEKPEQFERILDIFNGNDAQAVEKARTRWTSYKNAGHNISYLRQNESGGWEKRD